MIWSTAIPANKRRWPDVGLMLGQRRRRRGLLLIHNNSLTDHFHHQLLEIKMAD